MLMPIKLSTALMFAEASLVGLDPLIGNLKSKVRPPIMTVVPQQGRTIASCRAGAHPNRPKGPIHVVV